MDDQLFDPWCKTTEQSDQAKKLVILVEQKSARPKTLVFLKSVIPNHYFPDGVLERRLKRLGRVKTAASVRAILPKTKSAMSGDLGEILATEYVNRKLDFRVPILRLRWKDGREWALRGDDILAVKIEERTLHFLKGEVKSRIWLSASTVQNAATALNSNHGRPTAFVVNFVVNRLYELKQFELAEALEDHLTSKLLPLKRLTHFVFTLSGNDCSALLNNHLESCDGKIPNIAVGVVVDGHDAFVQSAYTEVLN